jgi:hypothetical protein
MDIMNLIPDFSEKQKSPLNKLNVEFIPKKKVKTKEVKQDKDMLENI